VIGTNCKRATRPCGCGYLGHYSGRCRCTPDEIARYRARISGPLLDRIDIQVEVPALPEADLVSEQRGESSKAVRERVESARRMQLRRQGSPNAHLTGREIEERARVDAQGRRLLRDAISRLGLSARGHHRVLKVARTIADLRQSSEVGSQDAAEALRYRGISATR
jgi:magnesium chelatase family protein